MQGGEGRMSDTAASATSGWKTTATLHVLLSAATTKNKGHKRSRISVEVTTSKGTESEQRSTKNAAAD